MRLLSRQDIEGILLSRVVFVGEEIPEGLDKTVSKFVLVGTPEDFITALLSQERLQDN